MKERMNRFSRKVAKAADRPSLVALVRDELPFPLDALPERVRTFAESIAVRFGVPVCVPATACLALPPQIAGTRVKIDRRFGLPLGCNLYFVAGADANSHVRAAVESVLNPAQRLRDDLIGQDESPGLTNPQMPYVSLPTKWRLRKLRGRSVPLLLSSGIPSMSWDRLLETTWCNVARCFVEWFAN